MRRGLPQRASLCHPPAARHPLVCGSVARRQPSCGAAQKKPPPVAPWLAAAVLAVPPTGCSPAAASYILYLGHTTSMGLVKSVLLRYLDITTGSHFLLATAIIFPAGVLLPYLLWRYVLTRFQITRTIFGLKPLK